MNPFEASAHVAARLDEDDLPYAIGGALALTAWALPRETKDVDISIFIGPAEIDRMFDSLERAGVMLDRADAAKAVARIGMFSGRLGRTNIDVFVSDHPHFHEMRKRRRQVEYPSGAKLWFITAEDLCLMKIVYGRTKDLADLERMFAALPLDVVYMRTWLTTLPQGATKVHLLDELVRRFMP